MNIDFEPLQDYPDYEMKIFVDPHNYNIMGRCRKVNDNKIIIVNLDRITEFGKVTSSAEFQNRVVEAIKGGVDII